MHIIQKQTKCMIIIANIYIKSPVIIVDLLSIDRSSSILFKNCMKFLAEYKCDLYIPSRFLEELLIIKLKVQILMVLIETERCDIFFRTKIIFFQ